jgi:hypothetical protein
VDEQALERARKRIAEAGGGNPEPADVSAALERTRWQIEALAATAAELQGSLPAALETTIREALLAEVLPVARHIAEIRGLLNQTIRRLERLEGDMLAERHARVDDLALLVDVVTSGWRSVEGRLERLERTPAEATAKTTGAVVEDLPAARPDETPIERAAAA